MLTSAYPAVSIPIKDYIPEACDARNFVSGYTTRLAAFSSTDPDVITGKKLLAIRTGWSDATALFPVTNDRGPGQSADIYLTLSLQSASASQLFNVSISPEGAQLADGTEVVLFWSMVGDGL